MPHPDDVVLDMRRGTVEVIVPLTDAEKLKHNNYKDLLAEYRKMRARYETTIETPIACEAERKHREWITEQLEICRAIIPMLEALTGQREMPPAHEVRKLQRRFGRGKSPD